MAIQRVEDPGAPVPDRVQSLAQRAARIEDLLQDLEVARLLPLLGPLVLLDVLAPLLGRQDGWPTWTILSVQGLAIAGLVAIVLGMARVRCR